jgi:ElaB/YqjD/DUF883 family membrane-anchored ribosome-binding protein
MASATNPATNNDKGVPPFPIQCESGLKHTVEQAGAACMDKAKEAACSVMDKTKEAVSSVAHTVGHAGAAIGEKAHDATDAVGSGMKSLAGTIRHNMPREGALGTASASVAESLESGGRYLQREGMGGMARDITDLIRRNPVPAVLVGIGIGFLLAKLTARGFAHAK